MNQRDHPGALRGREPVGQVQDDAGEEAGLGHAEQEPQHDQHGRVRRERHAVATMPQVTRMRAIQRRAPKRCSARLLGTSSSR